MDVRDIKLTSRTEEGLQDECLERPGITVNLINIIMDQK